MSIRISNVARAQFTYKGTPLVEQQNVGNVALLLNAENQDLTVSANGVPMFVNHQHMSIFTNSRPGPLGTAVYLNDGTLIDGKNASWNTVQNPPYMDIGDQDFTLEMMIDVSSVPNYDQGMLIRASDPTLLDRDGYAVAAFRWYLNAPGGVVNQMNFEWYGSDGTAFTVFGNMGLSSGWHHLAASRTNGILKLFLDGEMVGQGSVGTLNYNPYQCFQIGGASLEGIYTYPMNAYYDNIQITVGAGLYTGAFTSPI